MPARPFFDTNVVVYAFAADDPRGEQAERLLAVGGIISVQVLNEFVNVSRRKLGRDWTEIETQVAVLRTLLDPPLPLTIEIHDIAVALARDHMLAFYDALIVAAARQGGCDRLYSEDMQHGQSIAGLTIHNPFP